MFLFQPNNLNVVINAQNQGQIVEDKLMDLKGQKSMRISFDSYKINFL